jgi:predicted MPP superfamily phosphohydrolase
MLRRFLRRVVLGRVLRSIAIGLGLAQVAIGHWFTVVLAGREGPGVGVGTLLAAALVAANLALVPVLRRARAGSGLPNVLAQVYMSVGLATILLGLAVGAAWVGALPAGALLALLGVPPESAFQAFRMASGGVVLAVAGLLAWGFTGGQARIRHEVVSVPLAGLASALRGLRIVQLSDLHIGNGMKGARLEALVRRANELAPDLLVLTGDLFDADPAWIEPGCRALGALRAPCGVFAVLGNHDHYTGADRVARGLASFAPNVTLLRKELVRLALPEPLYLAGVDDPGTLWTARDLELPELEELARELPADGPVLLLVHRPEVFPQAARLGFPLVLAGHTHGGQLAVPGLAHRLNLARLMTRYDRGLFRENGSVLYVSRGAGVAGPSMRISTPREITTLELA